MPNRVEGQVTCRDAKIIFRNFRGKETEFNAKGSRNFCVILEPAVAEAMAADGWNIKLTKIREEGDIPEPYVQVKVGDPERGREANIQLITSRGRTRLGYEDCDILDYSEIVKVDLIFTPYNWEKGSTRGVSAYLKSMYVTIEEDELEQEYNSLPVSGEIDHDDIPTRSGRIDD